MRKNILLSLILIVAIGLTANAQQKKVRKLSEFSELDVAEGIKVSLTVDKTQKVEVVAPTEYIKNVITEVKGSELNIRMDDEFKRMFKFKKKPTIEVIVDAKRINSIDVSSGASVKTTNIIQNTEELEISASSGADAFINCKVKNVEADASSGADIEIIGETNFLEADASSGSDINAQELKANEVNADVSSGADIYVHAVKKIEADASSGGSIKYSGKPNFVDIDKSSGGSVKKR